MRQLNLKGADGGLPPLTYYFAADSAPELLIYLSYIRQKELSKGRWGGSPQSIAESEKLMQFRLLLGQFLEGWVARGEVSVESLTATIHLLDNSIQRIDYQSHPCLGDSVVNETLVPVRQVRLVPANSTGSAESGRDFLLNPFMVQVGQFIQGLLSGREGYLIGTCCDCKKIFAARREGQEFCSYRCRNRAGERRRYAERFQGIERGRVRVRTKTSRI